MRLRPGGAAIVAPLPVDAILAVLRTIPSIAVVPAGIPFELPPPPLPQALYPYFAAPGALPRTSARLRASHSLTAAGYIERFGDLLNASLDEAAAAVAATPPSAAQAVRLHRAGVAALLICTATAEC